MVGGTNFAKFPIESRPVPSLLHMGSPNTLASNAYKAPGTVVFVGSAVGTNPQRMAVPECEPLAEIANAPLGPPPTVEEGVVSVVGPWNLIGTCPLLESNCFAVASY